MPSLYIENSEKWKTLADIDYFTQFIKAWIPFNAWYKNCYPELETDSSAIEEIKSTGNKFRDRLMSLLNGNDTESIAFKSNIAKLHNELGRKYVRNKYEERICFDYIVIERNPKKKDEFTRNTVTYKVERGPRGQKESVIETIITTTTGIRFSFTQVHGFNINELKAHDDFGGLSTTQQNNIEACYKEINPRKPMNLLTKDEDNCIEMGTIKFIDDVETLCKGIIEVLYGLRNALFHGEIIPDKDTNKVYEPAYHILNALIQAL
jgi:hypothetical protein